MDIAKLILDYVLKALDGVNVVEAKTTLENAKKLIAALPAYQAEDALKALFQEVSEC